MADVLYSGLPDYVWNSIHTSALIVIAFSISGSAYIIGHTLMLLWRGEKLRLLQILPMLISICDAFFGFIHGSDHIVSITTGYVASGSSCVALGWLMIYSMNIQALWYIVMSYSIWRLLVRNNPVDWGKNDWKAHAFAWGLPFVTGLIPLAWNGYGFTGAWCGLSLGRDLIVFNVLYVLVAIIVNVILYSWTSWKLLESARVKFNTGLSSNGTQSKSMNTNTMNERQKKTIEIARSLPAFVLWYSIQWSAYTIYAIFSVMNPTAVIPLNIILCVVTFTNAGGIFDAVLYKRFLMKTRGKETGSELSRSGNAVNASGSRPGNVGTFAANESKSNA